MKKFNVIKLCAIAYLFFANSPFISAQGAGVLDPGFGNKGKVLSKIATNRDDIAQSVAIAPDNKIVVAGNSFNFIGFSNIGVIRYRANGALDRTFNGTGKTLIANAFANVVLVQPDYKIIVGGSVAVGSTTVFGVWRINSNGTMDSTFGTGGAVKIPFSNGSVICYAMTLQPNGKILIGGSTDIYGGYSNLVLARLNTNGTLDNTFGVGGRFSQTLSYRSLSCQKILFQRPGKIVVAGQYDTIINFEVFHHYMYAMRLNANGTVDPSFGINGWARYGSATDDYCYSAGMLPDSKIVLAGFSRLGASTPASVVCLNPNGNINSAFGTSGWQYVLFPGASAIADATCIETNGKIILAGYNTFAGGTQSVFLARLKTDGTLDPSFARNGKDTFFVSENGVSCNDAVLQRDGKILITGYLKPSPSIPDYYLTARFLNDPQLITHSSDPNLQKAVLATDVSIFPNPVTDNLLKLRFNAATSKDDVAISIYDFTGHKIMASYIIRKNEFTMEVTLNLPATMSNGMYACMVTTNGISKSIKFLLQK